MRMYAELKLILDTEQINYRKTSNLQGVIMENIDSSYAEKLHADGLNPYSQCVLREKQKVVWHIRTVTEEAYENLLLPMSKITGFRLKNLEENIGITERDVTVRQEESFLEEFYKKEELKYLDVEFRTPTAFKRDGKYVYYPDLSLLFGSLMRKYSMASVNLEMIDESALEQLVSGSEIARYRLQTVLFPMEKIYITGFCGKIRIRSRGTGTMARYARLLLRFGYYSGVGIKTGMGMGAICLPEGR